MTDADVAKLLGSGWKIDSQAVVTSGNQTDYAVDLTCSALLSKAVPDKQMGQGYLPPVGWTVVVAADPTYNVEYIWVEPGGQAWLLSKCTAFSASSEADPARFLVSGTGEGGGGWVLLLASAALVYLMLKGK